MPVAYCRQSDTGVQKSPLFRVGLCWRYLFSRPVARQVSSAQVSLTSVFGMGTGGPSPQSTPTVCHQVSLRTSTIILLFFHLSSSIFQIHSTARNPTKWLQAEAMSSGMIEHSSSLGCERYAACEELVTRTGFEPMLTA